MDMFVDATTLQERLGEAIDNYLEMSALIRQDVLDSLQSELQTQNWRRNYIRVIASLVDAHINCIQEICIICESFVPCMGKKERNVLLSEKRESLNDRFKYALRAAYKIFDLHPNPSFDGEGWHLAKRFLTVRNALMHPKKPADLKISDEHWIELQEAVFWMVQQLFNFTASLQARDITVRHSYSQHF
jgi:hypothetical protein